MTLLAQLAARLALVSSESFSFPASESLAKQIASMRRRGWSQKGGIIPSDQAERALQRFWDTKAFSTVRDARIVAYSLAMPFGDAKRCVLENPDWLKAALSEYDRLRAERARYRRCYRGVLATYFSYDPFADEVSQAGWQGWSMIRDYLSSRITDAAGHRVDPAWLVCVAQNPEILSAEPFHRLIGDQLVQEGAAARHVRHSLSISDASWFSRELLLAQLQCACKAGDPEFVAALPKLIKLIRENQMLRDVGLAKVLDRYVANSRVELHAGLREIAVKSWGNPWLPTNEAKWQRVSAPARRMVADWLKLEFVESFFTILAEEGQGDPRRLDFWRRYVDRMDSVHFALGPESLNSRSPDIRVLREKAKGLISPLLDGPMTGNAFIMTIAGHVLVEFSGIGNALYGYRADALPFDVRMGLRTAKNAPNSLKHSSRRIWETHADGNSMWEIKFRSMLARQGIMDSGDRRAPRQQEPRKGAREAPLTGPENEAASFSIANLQSLADAYGLGIDDRRGKGGSLWVVDAKQRPDISEVLVGWGFQFKGGRGWWRSQ